MVARRDAGLLSHPQQTLPVRERWFWKIYSASSSQTLHKPTEFSALIASYQSTCFLSDVFTSSRLSFVTSTIRNRALLPCIRRAKPQRLLKWKCLFIGRDIFLPGR